MDMAKKYKSKGFGGVAFCTLLMFGITVLFIITGDKTDEYAGLGIAIFVMLNVALFIVLTKMPICLIEADGLLTTKYLFRRESIRIDDITNIVYPFLTDGNDRRTCSYLFVLKDGREEVIPDAYWDFSGFASRWWAAHGREEYDCTAGLASHFADNGDSFTFATPLLRCGWFYAVVFAVVAFLFIVVLSLIWKITHKGVAGALSAILLYWMAERRITTFTVENGIMEIAGGLRGNLIHLVELSKVAGIRFRKYSLFIKLTDGTSIDVLYCLSEDRRAEFASRLRAMGIGCI